MKKLAGEEMIAGKGRKDFEDMSQLKAGVLEW